MGKPLITFPEEKEKAEAIIIAACKYFDIEKKDLFENGDRDIVSMRQQCFFLIKKNTILNAEKIAFLFDKSRRAVDYGIDQIEAQKNVYANIQRALRKIIEKANELTNNEFLLEYK